jgi:large subunit ribosomal protein LP2
MRYVAAYLLAALGGKENPNSADIEKILSSVGIEADAEKLKKVISELNGKNIEELIAAGNLILENYQICTKFTALRP